jgi:hypothetical protein
MVAEIRDRSRRICDRRQGGSVEDGCVESARQAVQTKGSTEQLSEPSLHVSETRSPTTMSWVECRDHESAIGRPDRSGKGG